jgi:hypothetical protein
VSETALPFGPQLDSYDAQIISDVSAHQTLLQMCRGEGDIVIHRLQGGDLSDGNEIQVMSDVPEVFNVFSAMTFELGGGLYKLNNAADPSLESARFRFRPLHLLSSDIPVSKFCCFQMGQRVPLRLAKLNLKSLAAKGLGRMMVGGAVELFTKFAFKVCFHHIVLPPPRYVPGAVTYDFDARRSDDGPPDRVTDPSKEVTYYDSRTASRTCAGGAGTPGCQIGYMDYTGCRQLNGVLVVTLCCFPTRTKICCYHM